MFSEKPVQIIALLLLVALTVVACGGSGDDSGTTHDGTPAVEPEAPADSSTAEEGHLLGEPLDHPERYYGLYANPETPDRQWFVTEAKRPEYAEQAPEVPPGYLAIGAMFGDVAPWHMKTISGTTFEQAWVSESQPEPATVEFELGDDGNAVAMAFTDEQNASQGRLVRVGELPEDWQ